MRRWVQVVGGVAVAVMLLGACGSNDKAEQPTTTTASSSTTNGDSAANGLKGSIVVMAPMPLNPVLERAKKAFEADNPGVKVRISYGHAPALMAQLKEGVPGDALLTPDQNTMKQAADASLLAGSPVPLAKSPLALVVPVGNPGHVAGLSSLADEKLTIVTCAAELPCGKLADQLAKKAGVTLAADSQEPGGSPAIVTKAATGEIDLGVVFAVDVKAGGDKVTAIPIPEKMAVSSQVTGAVLADASDPDVAQAFLEFLASKDGQALFSEAFAEL